MSIICTAAVLLLTLVGVDVWGWFLVVGTT